MTDDVKIPPLPGPVPLFTGDQMRAFYLQGYNDGLNVPRVLGAGLDPWPNSGDPVIADAPRAPEPIEGEIYAAPQPPAASSDALDAVRDVLAERHRQISAEGWTPEHDDHHSHGELAIAAACYASNAGTWQQRGTDDLRKTYAALSPGSRWPWLMKWWKPTNERRDLVKAGALILAEIERMDRAALKGNQP